MLCRSSMRALVLPSGLVVLAGVVASGCQPPSSPASTAPTKAAAPAKSGHPKEADLATVELTPEAETRVGLKLATVERKTVPLTITYGGEVMIPPGRLIAVTSPFVGLIKAPEGAGIPVPGITVKEGQPVFVLVPILSPEARAQMAPLLIESEGQVKQATEQLKIAKVTLDRAEELVRNHLGGSASLIDAKAQYDLAQTTLRAAESRRETIAKVAADSKTGDMSTQTITSPAAGMFQNVHAQAGQAVAAGAPLFEVASLDPVWIRVPVYVGDLARLDTRREADVGGLADTPGAPVLKASPVDAPPSGDPISATVHVFYEVENPQGALRPGQRVGVALPMRGEEQSLVVPLAALNRDIHGDAWVYEKTGEHAYTRRRVLVDRVSGDLAVLAGGRLKPGAEVVTDGAAELFGTEFGGAK
jgi:cobalt-zinc-cadmium efflux system membrane fusion protein